MPGVASSVAFLQGEPARRRLRKRLTALNRERGLKRGLMYGNREAIIPMAAIVILRSATGRPMLHIRIYP